MYKRQAPVSREWMIGKDDSDNVESSIPNELSSEGDIQPIKIRGWIDRVDLLPHDLDSGKWINNDGDDSVAPIRVHGSGWRPKRIVAIRDLKTSESALPRNRHYQGPSLILHLRRLRLLSMNVQCRDLH